MITSIKAFKEVFKPYNLAGRQQELREQMYKRLGQEILKGDLKVEPWMFDLDPSRVKVKKIDGYLDCRFLGLTSLPAWFQSIKEVTGSFYCSYNQLTSLEGSPQTVGGWFDCSDNMLTSLERGPQTVGVSFDCRNNQLTSLEGGPQIVRGWFSCINNRLTSLEGSPQTVGESFWCNNNKLTSLQGLPKEIGRDLWCYSNAKQFTETDIPSDTKIKREIYFKL